MPHRSHFPGIEYPLSWGISDPEANLTCLILGPFACESSALPNHTWSDPKSHDWAKWWSKASLPNGQGHTSFSNYTRYTESVIIYIYVYIYIYIYIYMLGVCVCEWNIWIDVKLLPIQSFRTQLGNSGKFQVTLLFCIQNSAWHLCEISVDVVVLDAGYAPSQLFTIRNACLSKCEPSELM